MPTDAERCRTSAAREEHGCRAGRRIGLEQSVGSLRGIKRGIISLLKKFVCLRGENNYGKQNNNQWENI